jgi:hypothetical protein
VVDDSEKMAEYFTLRVAQMKLEATQQGYLELRASGASVARPPPDMGWWARRKWAKGASDGMTAVILFGTLTRAKILKTRNESGLFGENWDELDQVDYDTLWRRYVTQLAYPENGGGSSLDGMHLAKELMQQGLNIASTLMKEWSDHLDNRLEMNSPDRGAAAVGFRETLLIARGRLLASAAGIHEESE